MAYAISKEDGKKFLLHKQFLLSPRSLKGINGIEQVFDSLRAIQYDPQNICARSMDLTLHARVSGIRPLDYYKWLYEGRNGVEFYDKELCVIPIKDLDICRGRYSFSRKKKLSDFTKTNKSGLDKVLAHITEYGASCSKDFEIKSDKKALDTLWKMGKLTICYRKNGIKYFDIFKKIYGKELILNHEKLITPTQVSRRIKGVGILPKSGTGSGWLGVGSGKEIQSCLDKLIASENITEIFVDGIKSSFVINSCDLVVLKNINKRKDSKLVSFLSPLDNIMWDRKLIHDLFGFDYKWEAYTPKEQRKYGHYVLPILYGLDFIGRFEPIYNRDVNSLDINGFWLENNHAWNLKLNTAFHTCLDEFRCFIGATSITWLCKEPCITRGWKTSDIQNFGIIRNG